MAKIRIWIRNHLPTQRRLIQLYTALLYNAHIKGFIKGNIYTGNIKMLCVPGLNCYSCPGAVGACPLGALQNAVASSGSRPPTYILGILLLFGLTLGRTICGYLCPVGLMQELLHKIPTPKIRKNRFTRALSYLKYGILAVFVLMIPAWHAIQSLPVPAFCKYICPAGTIEGAIGLLSNPINADKYSMLGHLFTNKFILMLVMIGACVFVYRAFCRFLCPLGAIYGLFAKGAVIGVKVDVPHCIDCGRCISHCKMDVRRVSDHECIHCGECIDVCPTGAISLKAGKMTLKGTEIPPMVDNGPRRPFSARKNLVWTVAIAVLIVGMVYVNRQEETPPQNSNQTLNTENTKIPIGREVGLRAPDFTVPVYGTDDVFTLSEQIGKTVVVNFWATWCTPCCNELPYFDAVYQQMVDQVSVVAVHSNLVTDDIEEYLAKFDYQMPFALDETGEIISSFGGSTMLPHTVIISPEGLITYNAAGSLTMEELASLVQAAEADRENDVTLKN